MNQTMYMVTRDTLRILYTKPYLHHKSNHLGKDASFNIDENFCKEPKEMFLKCSSIFIFAHVI